MKVLIVDDEQELVETLVERFEIRGIQSVGLTDAHAALQRLSEEEFDVVLVDVKMPGMGGLDLIKRIKSKRREQQVVMLTGHGSVDHMKDGLCSGAFAYLMKPVKVDELIEILEDAANDQEWPEQ